MKLHPISAFLTALCFAHSAYALSPGDIAFTGFNADGDDDLAFVALSPIPSGTEIHFTDSEWNGTALSGDEGSFTWTAGSDIPVGTIVTLSSLNASAARTSNLGTFTATSGSFNISGSDEAVFAYAGTLATPSTFLAVIANEDAAGAGFNLTGTGLSEAAGTAIIFTGDEDGMRYTGPRSGQATYAGHLTALADKTNNWETDSSDGTLYLPFSESRFLILSNQLLLTEIQSNQASAGANDFWELTNIGDTAVDLGGWKWDDNSRNPADAEAVTIPSGASIAAGESIIFTSLADASFRSWWGISPTVQIITGGPGLGQNDGIALFNAANVEQFFFNYTAGGFTKSDGSPSAGGHAGASAGGTATQSLVWDPAFGTVSPRYTAAAVGVNGGVASTISASDIGSPGFSGFSTGSGPSITLSLSVTPASFSESATNPAATGTVTRDAATAEELVVTLASSDTTEATVPATVTIPANQTSVNFDVTAINDNFPDGNKTATLTASATDATTPTFDLTVQDDGDVITTNLMLTEIQSNQASTAAGTEDYWELTNFGASAVSLAGYSWHDSGRSGATAATYALPPGTTIAPGESVIFTVAAPTDFRTWWGIPNTVQVFQTTGAPGLGQGDGVSFFDEGQNELFFFSYAASGFTKEDGNPSLGGHAGPSGGGSSDTQALVWVPTSGTTSPRYAAATGSNFGSFQAVSGADFGSPGLAGSSTTTDTSVTISDVSVEEGNSGTTTLTFTVTRDDTLGAFTVDYATSNGSATEPADYTAASGTLNFTAAGPATQDITITVNGDGDVETDETVFVTLSNIVNTTGTAALADAQGVGTIENDDLYVQPTNRLAFSTLGSITLGGAEIPAFDKASKRAFVSSNSGIQVVDLTNPSAPAALPTINLIALGLPSNDVSSVAVRNGVLVACTIASPKTAPGKLIFLNAADGTLIGSIDVGANPDQLTFTPDGTKILVANEGELNGSAAVVSDDTTLGSVSIVDVSGGYGSPVVTTADFTSFNSQVAALKTAGVRIFDGGIPSTDFEPEYVAVSPDGTKAMVTLQEANAVALLDIATATFTAVVPLGEKDFSPLLADFSDRDGPSASNKINLTTGNPVFGLYMPDAIASFSANGQTYYITANEGDDRNDFLTPDETTTVGNVGFDLDDTTFPNESLLKTEASLGRLTVSNSTGLRGDSNNDGDIDRILALGARSFSIHDANGNRVFDSGDMIEKIVAGQFPANFFDSRSDNKGPEPEGVITARIGSRTYAFVGLERSHMTLAFDVTDPNNVSYAGAALRPGDLNPEGLVFVNAADSPNGKHLLLVANEDSNTLSVFEIEEATDFTLQLLHLADAEAGLLASQTAPNLAALVDAFDGTYPNTLILAGGDNYIPGPFAAAGTDPLVAATHDKGNNPFAADIEIHNRLGVEASTIGNHEFDFGTNAFSDAIADTNFPYLSSNLDFSGDSGISARYQETVGTSGLEDATSVKKKIVPSCVVTKGTEKIGLVGVTTQILETISSTGNVEVKGFAGDGSETNDMALLASQVQPVINDLISQGVDKIVLMAHLQQITFEQQLAPLLTGVDIILAAGSNTRLGDSNDVAVAFTGHAANFAGNYPIYTAGADGLPTVIVNTDNEFTYLGRLVADFDADGVLIVPNLLANTAVNGAYAATAVNAAATWGVAEGDLPTTAFAPGTKGALVKQITDAVQGVITVKDGDVRGYTDVYLEGERNFVRNQETNLGDISADSMIFVGQTALPSALHVAALKNGGGIRAAIGAVDVVSGDKLPPIANPAAGKPAGGISLLDIENSMRFNNGLMLCDTTPAGLKAILEHGVASLGNQGRFPQIGGIRFSYDPAATAGSRVQSIVLIDEDDNITGRVVSGGTVRTDAPATITLVTLNFLANGGDGYPFKANADNFRFLLNDGSLSAPVDEGLSFTSGVPANILGEQLALSNYLQDRYASPAAAYDIAETEPALDTRTQGLNVRSDTVLAGPATFTAWLAENGYSSGGINTDTDLDGSTDLVEYFFNQSPNDSSDLGNLPAATTSGSDRLLTYTTNDTVAGVSGTLLCSDDLGISDPWAPAVEGLDYEVVSSSSSGGQTTTTLRVLGGGSSKFFRFAVE